MTLLARKPTGESMGAKQAGHSEHKCDDVLPTRILGSTANNPKSGNPLDWKPQYLAPWT